MWLSVSRSLSLHLSLSLTTTWVASKSTISLILIVQLSPRFMLLTWKLVRAWSNQKASSQNRSWAYKLKLLIWFKPLAFGCNRRRWSILDLDNHFKLCFMLQDAAGFLEGIYSWKGNICGHRRRMERESLSAWFPSSFITKIHFLSRPIYETELMYTWKCDTLRGNRKHVETENVTRKLVNVNFT